MADRWREKVSAWQHRQDMSFSQGRAVGAVLSLGIALAGQVFSQNSAGAHNRVIGKGGMLTAVLAKESMSSFFMKPQLYWSSMAVSFWYMCHSYWNR